MLSLWVCSIGLFLKLDDDELLFFDDRGSFGRGRAIFGGLVSSAGPVGATNREEGLLDGQEVDAPLADTIFFFLKRFSSYGIVHNNNIGHQLKYF